jgi:clan AA aspartic protease (TIGR02281 family)
MNSFFRAASRSLFFLALTLVTDRSYSQQESVPTVSVAKPGVKLYARQEEQSEVVAEIGPGEKLSPLAATSAKDPWYLVKTEKGVLGWIKASDIQVSEKLGNAFRESPSSSPASLQAASPAASPDDGITIPVEMNGATIVVPVLLNRSMKTYMIMDTGASLTLISPHAAKKLGLKLGPRISLITANGTTSAPLARLGSLKVGKAEAHGVDVTVQDFSPDPRIEGLLGLNFLSRFHVSIDSKRQRLTLTPR